MSAGTGANPMGAALLDQATTQYFFRSQDRWVDEFLRMVDELYPEELFPFGYWF